ncbi:T9SS C-terminal target domain-containing protein [Okeania hirsuta]|uniref:T9SS C-terminal target domain-containing protein n=1 Tax=Okeania hirsuta TaxID=1458930 RepID=A0A3N6QP83_9CYAN|nr:T9SS C-terminal target domain-containing protein [Okeania hirsuta]
MGANIVGQTNNDGSGINVSISDNGEYVAFGSPFNEENGMWTGQVRIFMWDGAAWVQRGSDIEGLEIMGRTGFSVSLSSVGDRVAIGAIGINGNTGRTRIYQWSHSDWVQIGNDLYGSGGESYFGFANSFAANGNRLIVGSSASGAGYARVYDWSDSSWVQLEEISGNLSSPAAQLFGTAVSISSDGSTAAVGASRSRGNGGAFRQGLTGAYSLPDLATSLAPQIFARHSIDQLFPNPSDHITTLTYSLEKSGDVSLQLFNDLGQLIHERMEIGYLGENQIRLDVSDLAEGLYTLSLTFEGISISRLLFVF